MVDATVAGILGLPMQDEEKITTAKQLARVTNEAVLDEKQRTYMEVQVAIADKQEEVEKHQHDQKFAATAYEGAVQKIEKDTQHYAKELALSEEKRSHMIDRIFELVPASIFPVNGVMLYDALVLNDMEHVTPDVGYEDFIETLDGLSWGESAILTQDVIHLRDIEYKHADLKKDIKEYEKQSPSVLASAEKLFKMSQDKTHKAVNELMVLMERSEALKADYAKSARDHDEKFESTTPFNDPPTKETEDFERILDERVNADLTTDTTVNVVGMAATASVGQIMATATAMVEKNSEAIKMEQAKAPAQERAIEYGVKNIVTNQDVINQILALNNISYDEQQKWKAGLRTKDGSKAMRIAVDVLNEEMNNGLINRTMGIQFDSKHAREMLALRTGIIQKYGKIDIRVISRWDKEENTIMCHFPDFNKTALVSIYIRSHGAWKISTIKSAEVTDWTYFENNSPPVPRGVKDIKGIPLEDHAKYYDVIIDHAEKKGQRISVDQIDAA